MFTHAAVLNNGTVVRETQLLNVFCICVTDAVLPNTTDCSLRKLRKRFDKLVTPPMERTAARSHIANRTLVPPIVNPDAVSCGPLNSRSSQPVSYGFRPLVLFLRFKSRAVMFCPLCGVILTIACLYGSSVAVPSLVARSMTSPPTVRDT